MARIVKCAVCGSGFETQARNVKYCPECRKAANRAKQYETEKRARAARRASNPNPNPKIGTYDSEEQVQKCLNCTQKHCPGWCKETGRPI